MSGLLNCFVIFAEWRPPNLQLPEVVSPPGQPGNTSQISLSPTGLKQMPFMPSGITSPPASSHGWELRSPKFKMTVAHIPLQSPCNLHEHIRPVKYSTHWDNFYLPCTRFKLCYSSLTDTSFVWKPCFPNSASALHLLWPIAMVCHLLSTV